MENNASHILDIHTHKSEDVSHGKAIINYPLPVDDSLCLSVSDVRTAGKEGYFYSVGIHPWKLTERNAEEQFELLQQLLVKEQFVAVGEAGLDKLTAAPMELQVRMFEKQVELSEKYRLPLIIHCVKAMEELLAVRKKLNPAQPWIWHGFRGKPQQAEQLIKNGIYLSFGAHYPEETVRGVPVGHLFLETDASPVDIEEVLRQVAKARSTDVEELRQAIRENIQKVFFRR